MFPPGDQYSAFALNLRFDLRRLTVEELAERLDLMADGCEEAAGQCGRSKLRNSWRGLIRHRWAYPFTSFMCVTGSFYFYLAAAFQVTIGSLLPRIPHDAPHDRPMMRWYLSTCEGDDILDELALRNRRQAG